MTDSYNYSFTGASLLIPDFIRLAQYIDDQELSNELSELDADKIMRREKKGTNKREFQELIKRYKVLTDKQQRDLINMDGEGQRQLAFLSACKVYSFLRDFVVEVLRDKFLLLDYELTDGDYNAFVNQKSLSHPELESFAASTAKKAKQVVFKMLEEGGLINNTKDRIIQSQFLNPLVQTSVLQDNPEWMKVFLFTDQEINLILHEA